MVSINPGIALGGAILGITPGAALEKKSVRDIAAGFAANKLGKKSYPISYYSHDLFLILFMICPCFCQRKHHFCVL